MMALQYWRRGKSADRRRMEESQGGSPQGIPPIRFRYAADGETRFAVPPYAAFERDQASAAAV
jgi:hypothetical protein